MICPECHSTEFKEDPDTHWDYQCLGCLFVWSKEEITPENASFSKQVSEGESK